jgi:Yip1 domain
METRPGTDRGAGYEVAADGAPPAQEKASIIEDFIDIFYAPSTVFARREKSGFALHLLIITALSALFAFATRSVFSQIFDAEYSRGVAKAMAKDPRITQEMLDKMRPIQENVASFFVYVGTPVAIFFTALVVWLVAKMFSAKLTYGQSALITTLAWIPRLVGGLLGVLLVLFTDTSNVTSAFSLTFGPARFMNPDTTNAKLYALMGSLDVFAIWYTVLIGIGIAVVAKVPRAKGYAAAAVVFTLMTLLLVAFR